jgi:hypothetical protein
MDNIRIQNCSKIFLILTHYLCIQHFLIIKKRLPDLYILEIFHIYTYKLAFIIVLD